MAKQEDEGDLQLLSPTFKQLNTLLHRPEKPLLKKKGRLDNTLDGNPTSSKWTSPSLHHFLLPRITSSRFCFKCVPSKPPSWCQASLQEKEAKHREGSRFLPAPRDALDAATAPIQDAPLSKPGWRSSLSPPHPLPLQDCEREVTLPRLAQRKKTAARPGFVIRALTLVRSQSKGVTSNPFLEWGAMGGWSRVCSQQG